MRSDEKRGRSTQTLVHWRIRGESVAKAKYAGRLKSGRRLQYSNPFLYPKHKKEETGMKPGVKNCFAAGVAVMLTLAGALSAKAQDVSQAEKERALQYL